MPKSLSSLISKELSKNEDKPHSLKEFDLIATSLYRKAMVADIDADKDDIKAAMAKYSKVSKRHIVFDTDVKTKNTYAKLKSMINGSGSDSNSDSDDDKDKSKDKKKPSAVKKGGGFGVFTKTADKEDDARIAKSKPKGKQRNKSNYSYPKEPRCEYKKPTGFQLDPCGEQWIHDKQVDDPMTSKLKRRQKIYNELAAMEYPEQRSKQWFTMREGAITASDGGCVMNENHHEEPYKFILKKLGKSPFINNEFVHHGKKYEQIATMIYEYRMNVKVTEFGLVVHKNYPFIAASPDGIVSLYKLDGKHITKYVGRMLEIKCPYRRYIQHTGEIKGGIVPDYYWVQVQQQLECCDLEECDFWQCKLEEYASRQDFIDDTDENEPFRSVETSFEKGCVIQLLPRSKYKAFSMESRDDNGNEVYDSNHDEYLQNMYAHTKYIYPPKIEMSPYECDQWVIEMLQTLEDDYPGYCFDGVIYWKLIRSGCVTVNRDREWFI